MPNILGPRVTPRASEDASTPADNQPDSKNNGYTPPTSEEMAPMRSEYMAELASRDQLLYIEAVSEHGVALLTLDRPTGQLLRWTDSWVQWAQRMQVRTVLYAGQRQPLSADM